MSETNWWEKTPELKHYYYYEWGVPTHNDQELFEILTLEMLQSGLSWAIVLKKRQAFRDAFYGFSIPRVAKMDPVEIDVLMQNSELIRNRRKLDAIVNNAQAIQNVQQNVGSFDQYLWSFVDGKQIINHPRTSSDIPSQTPLSAKIAENMKSHRFKFVGPVTVYSFLQGAGIVDDHRAGWQLSDNEA